MKFNIRNIVLILIIVMLASFLMAGALGATIAPFWGGFFLNQPLVDIDETHEFTAVEIRQLDVDTISTDINIIPVEGDEIKVHLYGQVTPDVLAEEFARVSGSQLHVTIRPRSGINMNTQFRLTLDIYVPAGYVETIVADTISGDLNVSELDLLKVELKTVSGDLTAANLNLESADFQSVSGSLRARAFHADRAQLRTTSGNMDITGFAGDITAKSVSGDIIVEYTSFANNITFDTTSGKTRLTLPTDAAFSVRLDTVSGKVNSDFPLTVHSSSRSRFEGTVGSSDNRIEVKSVSGDVTLTQQ